MKKNTLLLFMLILPLFGYSQLAEEGFEGTWGTSGPVGWGIYHNTVGSVNWRQTVLGNIFEPAYEDDYAAFLAPENVPAGEPSKDWLVTPQFNLPAHPKLTFYTRQVQNGSQGSTYRLLITTGDPSVYNNYTVVEEWTELELNPAQTDYIQVDVTNFPVAFLNQDVHIAFYMEGDNADGWFIDNVSVVEQCLTPEDLDAQNITTQSADLSWTDIAGADEWEIEFLEATEAATGTGVPYSGNIPYFKDGLNPNTNYKFLVRAVCDDGSSAWAGPFVFTTLSLGDTCDEPYEFNTLPYYITGNTTDNANNYEGSAGEETGCGVIAWQEYLNGNDVIFEYTPTFTGEIIINLTNASNASGVFVYDSCEAIGVECIGGAVTGWEGTSASIPSLSVSVGETYYILISSLNGTTPYTLAIQQVGCEQPEGLPTTGADLDSALLSWTNPTDADSWEIVIQAPGLGLPVGSGETADTNTNYLADELNPATPYEYYVRADCGDGTFSAWSGPYLFNTSICDIAQQCDYTFVLTDSGANGWNENTMTVSQNGVTVAVLGPDFVSGAGPVTVTVPLCDGMPLQLYWNSGGFDEQQIGVAIKNPFGQTIYAKAPGQGVQNSLLFDGEADCNTILCLPPSDLTATNATLETIDLGWDGPSTGSWEYVIVPAGDPAPGDADSGEETSTNPVTVDDLDPATNYEYYVRMLCDGADPNSDWAGPYPFSTAICPPANQCNYSFVMTSPDGIGYQGHNLTISQNGINVATIGSNFTEGESMTVTVPLCEGQPFQVYWNLGGGGIQIGLSIINAFGQTLYSITPGDETPGSLIYTGDIVDCDNPACMPPNNLTASNPTMDSIDLSWEGLPTGAWDYYVTEAGNPAPTADTPGEFTDTNPVTVPDLIASTNYEYYVRVICSGGPETSEWAGPFPFNTIVCDPAGQCVYTFEMTSALGWGWEGHTMSVFQGGVPIATIGNDFQGGSSQTVDIPLCPGVEVEVFWNDGGWGNPNDKGLVIYTPYMEDFFEMLPGEGTQNTTIFTGTPDCIAPLCPKPQDLDTGDITETTAVLNWTEMGTATDWEIWVLPTSAPMPTTPGTEVEDTASYLAEDLAPGAAYVFYVRANCGDGNFSTWSGPFLFATPLLNDDCDTAAVLIPAEGVECTNPVSGILNGSTSSGVTSNCTWGTPNNDVWYQFVATATTHNVSITNQTGEYLPFHAIYENTCGELNEIYCGYDAGGSTISELTIGNTYWVQVYMDPGSPELTSITSFDICILTPTGVSIIIDQDEYTVEEIVTDVLINSNCGGVSNITWSTGISHGAVSNGIAYFHQGSTDFPLEEGILLTTGFAKQAMGPNTSTMGNDPLGGGDWWPGDDQLFDYVQESGINPFLMSLNQASILEFDFVPVTDHIKFPFIFASEEYDGSSQCFYSDAFAFFLTDQDGNVTNLGVIPESTVPVTSKTIRDEQYNDPSYEFPCESVNPALFDKYYGPFNGLNPLTAPTNYNGHTKVLYAEADVIPGQTYHIKMVVADDLSTAMDTGVFIGPFDIGNVDIGVDLTVEDGNALCYGVEYTIESGLDPELYQITWSQDGEIIEGETGPNLTVTEPGEYTINVQYLTTTCGGSDTVVIEYHPAVEEVVGDPIDLMLCDPDGIATFSFSQNVAIMLAGLPVSDYTITFHLNEADATSGNAPLEMIYENVTPFLQTIYVRIVNEVTGCTAVKQFTLIVVDTPPQFELTPDLVLCDAASGTLTVTPLDFDADDATYAWTYNGNPVGDSSPAIQGIGFGEYTVTVTLGSCSETKTTSITEDSGAVAMQIHHGCEGTVYMISVSAVDGSFDLESSEISWSGPNGFSSAQAASEIQSEGTYTVTVTTAEGCIGQQSVNVESTSCLIPRGISPNGDGKNDAFDLEGFNVRRLSIFNRYGREVYSFEGIYTNQWHGQTDNGEELPTGTYFYSLERDNGETKTGWVYINTQEN